MHIHSKRQIQRACTLVLTCGLALSGVTQAADPKPGAKQPVTQKGVAKPPEKTEVPGHEHPSAGPHDGALIELGDEEYHAEIVVDEKKDLVTIYLLDSHATKSVVSDAKEIAINLKHGSKGVQYKLKPQPQKEDAAGKSSRFSVKSHDLIHALEHKDAKPMLRLAILGKTYTGKIEHLDHDHDHDHPVKK